MNNIVKPKVQNIFHWKGDRLKALRKAHKLTQIQLGRKLNRDGTTILWYEKNKISPPPEMELELCKFFNVEPNYFRII